MTEPAAPSDRTLRPSSAHAGFWRRLAASLYDALLLVAIWMIGGLVVVVARGEAVPPLTWWFELYLVALAFGYFGWSWVRGGQTLGMRAWRIRVARADGSALGWRGALVRFVVAGLAWLALGLGAWAARGEGATSAAGIAGVLVGATSLLWSLVDTRGRGWHDLAAGSVVLNAPRRA